MAHTSAFASLVLHARAAATTDPSAGRLLRQMADEEARHAELAWAIVTWAVDRQPALADAIQHAWQSRVTAPPATGWLPAETEARLHREALERVVLPCLRALAAQDGLAGSLDCCAPSRVIWAIR
jgi:hypothetical protein